jgi:hypothetical protein
MTESILTALRGLRRLAGRAGRRDASGGPRQRRPALLDGPRFRLGVVAILKNEALYLEEWLCHHMAVGVEHFLLYDNGSDDDLHAVIRPYVSHGLVTLAWFPLRGGQRDANNHAVRWFGGTAEWLAFLDLDEFLVPHGDVSVPTLLSRLGDAEQVLVARREFCYSGHRERPPGLVTEEYRLASESVPRVGGSNVLGKPIVRPEGVARVGVHAATTVSGATVDVRGRRVPEAKPLAQPVFAPLQVNHYYTKSFAEFEAKRARASTSTHAFPLPEVPFDIPAVPDDTVDRWVPRTKALMAEMRALSSDPYRFGSRLRLPDFPRNDQFSVQATAVVANELAGLTVPRKMRAMDLPRVPGLRGAVGRASPAYEPALGHFVGSVHARQHLAWLAAEVDWSLAAGRPDGLVVEGAVLDRARLGGPADATWDGAGAWVLRPDGTATPSITGPVRTAGLRCRALLLSVRTSAPLRVEVATRVVPAEGAGGARAAWVGAAAFDLAEPGTWLGLVALDEDPMAADEVRVAFRDRGARGSAAPVEGEEEAPLRLAGPVEVFDLALVSFG